MQQFDFFQKLLFVLGITVWIGWAYNRITRPALAKSLYPVKVKIGADLILIFILIFLLIAGISLQFFASINLKSAHTEEMTRLVQQIFADMIAKIITLILMLYIYIKRISFPGQSTKSSDLIRILSIAALLYLAIFPLVNVGMFSLGIYFVKDILGLPVDNIQHPALKLLSSSSVGIFPKIICLLLAAIVSPIAEELFFRGMLQNWIFSKLARPILSIILASIAFMLVHVPLYPQLPALWLLGIILGWAYWRYGTILIPIATHIIFNTVTLIMWHWQS